MPDAAESFHAARDAALRGDAALKALMGDPVRIFSSVPQNIRPPYFVTGQDDIVDDSDACLEGTEITATITFWVKPARPDDGPALARQVGARVRALMNALTVTDFDQLVDIPFQSASYATQADESTRGVVVAEFNLEPNT